MSKEHKLVDEKTGEEMAIKDFSVYIEPMYVGRDGDKRLEVVVTVRKYDPKREGFDVYQAIVPPKSRLDQELKKLLELKQA